MSAYPGPSSGAAAQALNGQHPELTYADADSEDEDDRQEPQELPEQRQLLGSLAARKMSLSERRNVELPHLRVVDERPTEAKPSPPERGSSPADTPPPSEAFAPGLRRNSISMPSGINALDLEALRLRHQMQPQEALHEEIVS